MEFWSKSWHLCPGKATPTHSLLLMDRSFLPAPAGGNGLLGTSLPNPGIFKVSLFHSDLPLSDNQRLGEEGKAALGGSPWHWLTHSGILTGGKNISLALSAGCCHRLSFQDPVFMPGASAASPPVRKLQGTERRSPSPHCRLPPHLQLQRPSPRPGTSRNALKSH